MNGKSFRLRDKVPWWLQGATAFALSGSVTVLCVSEITARIQFAEQLAHVQSTRASTVVQLAKSLSAGAGAESNVTAIHEEIDLLESGIGLREELVALEATGAYKAAQTLHGLRAAMTRLDLRGQDSDVPSPTSIFIATCFRYVGETTETLSNDQLLAIAMVAAAALGCAITFFERDRSVRLSEVALAGGTGLIAFFVVKGGKQVFLLQLDAEPVSINPYTSVLLALISGMFRQQFKQLLGTAVRLTAEKAKGFLPIESK